MIRLHGIPLYWGIEKDAPDHSWFTRAFLNEPLPPYRESDRAIRVRLSPWHWLHVGIFTYRTDIKRWGLKEVSPYEIGRWGLEAQDEDDDDGADSWDEVLPLDRPGPDQLHRVGDAEDRRTVSWAVPPGDGQQVDTG